jgi:hypothetical protein
MNKIESSISIVQFLYALRVLCGLVFFLTQQRLQCCTLVG